VAEGARLESVYTLTGIGGSNPSLSAMQSGVQRKSAFSPSEIRERCPFFADFASKRDCREGTEVAALATKFGFFSEPASSSPVSQVCAGEPIHKFTIQRSRDLSLRMETEAPGSAIEPQSPHPPISVPSSAASPTS
jgi:hypothetical protein